MKFILDPPKSSSYYCFKHFPLIKSEKADSYLEINDKIINPLASLFSKISPLPNYSNSYSLF